ncbi:MAG: M48 family peptidase [Bacteroidetes bacterium]|nr:MAG: M48 family peptidase [Bacteroidota bacterium]
MQNKTIYLKGIGEIQLKKSTRAKRLSIKVKPFDGVVAVMPNRISYKTAEAFIIEKQDWIKKSLNQMATVEEQRTVFTEKTGFYTLWHKLNLEKGNGSRFYTRITDTEIRVKYPKDILVRDEKVQIVIRKGIEKAWMIEANEIFPDKLKMLAKKHGFKYKSLKIKNTKSLWGSCSYHNEISLSLHLMRIPEHLIDYIILHELCHTIEKNHGKGFWALLEKVSGNAKGLRNELKNYNAKVY